ncbi:hypothetical protein [Burkholderia ubonensis]|uniref:hypothetical protein n=1 Tax=Burkholderia ubonensis TaxID=101571 RepID=UPI000ACF20FB|nr:hypothetical protein [Burkholderia ubonensis]
MSDTTMIYKYPKASVSEDQINALATNKLAYGAKSAKVTSDDTYWILTITWPTFD